MNDALKKLVFDANIELKNSDLVVLTWGNASQIDRENNHVYIKPSGVSYSTMTYRDIVVVDLDGNIVEGNYKPSSDLATHLEIYKRFPEIGGIVHTHSRWATIFAQSEMAIPPLGTTHADAFYGAVPCTRKMTESEIEGEYEKETGKVICETFSDINPMDIPAVLVNSHGPFTFGVNVKKAVENAITLEEVAMMAWHSLMMNKDIQFQEELLTKHYLRKHGANAYYGQSK